jgi:hypothetical protein
MTGGRQQIRRHTRSVLNLTKAKGHHPVMVAQFAMIVPHSLSF